MSENRNVPKLRFSGFSEYWEKKILSEISSKITDGTHDTPKPSETGVPFLTAVHVKDGFLDFGNCYFLPEEVHKQIYKRCNPEYGDLLMVNIGSGTGTSAMVDVDFEFSLKNVALVKPDNKKVDPCFLSQIQRENALRLKHQLSSGGAQPFLSLKEIGKIKLNLPSLPEQQKIAEFLTAVDQRIELLQAKKEKLEVYKKGVMQKIFPSTGSGQVPQLRFKADDGSEFPNWEERKLGEIIQFSKGKGLPKSDITDEGSLKCIHYGELFTKYKEHITHIKSRTFEGPNMTLSEKNDVLMPTSDVTPNGLATASCIKETGVVLGGDILILRQKVTVLDGVFLAYFISKNRKEVMRRVAGSTVYHLYGSDMKTILVQVPSLEEQKKIVSFLTILESSIENLNNQINHTQIWKKGLLQKMFV